jgi:hypothetical protein
MPPVVLNPAAVVWFADHDAQLWISPLSKERDAEFLRAVPMVEKKTHRRRAGRGGGVMIGRDGVNTTGPRPVQLRKAEGGEVEISPPMTRLRRRRPSLDSHRMDVR